MTRKDSLDESIEEAREEIDRAYAENIEQSDILLELTREKSEEFQSELWRGLLAVNGAGLAAAATILSIDGFPSPFLKASAFLFFLGLLAAAYSWGLGLGYSFWSRQLASKGRTNVETSMEWARARGVGLSAGEQRKRMSHGKELVRRVQMSTRSIKTLQSARLLVPSVGLCSAAFFAVGASVLITGLMMFERPVQEDPIIQIVLSPESSRR